MIDFLNGAILMSYATVGLFFLKFWKKSHDRFYALFAVAFFVLAANRIMSDPTSSEGLPVFYVVRLFAFLLILGAIIDKNRVKS